MKYLYYLFFLTSSAILVAEEPFQKSDALPEVTEQALDKIELNEQDLKEIVKPKDSYYYLKLGASPLVQNVGFGHRSRDIKKRRANDFTVNCHAFLLGLGKRNDLFLPSFKYSYLKYKDPIIRSSYFGVGYELCVLLKTSHGRILRTVIPNIELVWGSERDNFHFSQFGINLLPTAVVIYLATMGALGERGSDSAGFAFLGAVASSAAAISYTIGF